MTPQEIERNIAFIVEQQANFSVNLDRTNAAIDKINETLAKHNEAIVGLLQISRTLLDHHTAAEAQMTEIRTEMKEIARIQKSTDQRLNVLIDVLERHIAGHDHGRPPSA
jgi:ABC-type transporter Mla subunit MlaD